MAKKNTSKTQPAGDTLYAEESVVVAVEAAKKAAQHIIDRNFDVHFRDACIKVGLEANALISGHEHEIESLPKFDLPQDEQRAGEMILELCDECEKSLPKGGHADLSAIDPNTVIQFVQLFMQVWNFFRRKDQLAPQS